MAHENNSPTIGPDGLPAIFAAYRESSSKRQAESSLQIENAIQRLNIALTLIDGDKVSEAREVIASQLNALQKKAYEEKIATWETILGTFREKDQSAFSESERAEFSELEEYLLSTKAKLASLMRQESSDDATAA